jgi:hypothetical protein
VVSDTARPDHNAYIAAVVDKAGHVAGLGGVNDVLVVNSEQVAAADAWKKLGEPLAFILTPLLRLTTPNSILGEALSSTTH